MKKFSLVSAVIYLGIPAVAAVIFFISTIAGNYTVIERVGGAVWVFMLLTIILMPIVIPWVNKKFSK